MGAILKVRDTEGTVHEIYALQGKSAYQYAQEGGYTGTEAAFAAKLAQEKFANPNALTFTGAVTGSYDGSEAVTVEIPSGGGGGGGGGSSTFMIDTTTEEVSAVSWTLPANWRKILILNIHITVPSQNADMSLYAKFGDSGGYKSIGTLTASEKNGVDVYLLKTRENYMGIGTNIAKTYPENAKPVMPSSTIAPDLDTSGLRLYSNTSGVNFPTGTIFKIWGVYAP